MASASGSGGISGVAVAAAAAGALLIVAGIKDAPLLEALKEVLSGRAPTGRAPVQTPVAASSGDAGALVGSAAGIGAAGATGAAIAAAARGWIGVPYVWGGTSRSGVDCSGLVYRCLNEAGIKVSRMTSYGYRAWKGAQDIARSQCAAGDLVCYTGHIAIATSNSTMIHAPRPGKTVTERSIYNGQGGPIIRRVK